MKNNIRNDSTLSFKLLRKLHLDARSNNLSLAKNISQSSFKTDCEPYEKASLVKEKLSSKVTMFENQAKSLIN